MNCSDKWRAAKSSVEKCEIDDHVRQVTLQTINWLEFLDPYNPPSTVHYCEREDGLTLISEKDEEGSFDEITITECGAIQITYWEEERCIASLDISHFEFRRS